MATLNRPAEDAPFFRVSHARWVVGVLNMLIGVVGKETLLGLILRQTRTEITSIIRDETSDPVAARVARYRDN